MKCRGKIIVTLRPGVFDPQGVTIKSALHTLGYGETLEVKTGKFFEVILETESLEKAKERLQEMCDQLLANPVIEQYLLEVEEQSR